MLRPAYLFRNPVWRFVGVTSMSTLHAKLDGPTTMFLIAIVLTLVALAILLFGHK